MQNITKQTRIETYRNADDVIKDMYGSETLGEKIITLCNTYAIEEGKVPFINVIGDVILGFYKVADLPQLLQKNVGIGADDSQRITSELIEFLSPIVKREEREANEKKEGLAKLADTFKTTEKTEAVEVPIEESAVEKVPSIRTMQSDANRAHGYGSLHENQDDDEAIVKALDQDQTLGR